MISECYTYNHTRSGRKMTANSRGFVIYFKKLEFPDGHYLVISVATLIGLAMNFVGINPIRALVFTAVFNGVAAVPLIYIIARINSSKKILDKNRGGILSRSLVWLTFAVMAIAAIAMFYTLARPH